MSGAARKIMGKYGTLFVGTDGEVLGRAARKDKPVARAVDQAGVPSIMGVGETGKGSMAQALSSDLGPFLMPPLGQRCAIPRLCQNPEVFSQLRSEGETQSGLLELCATGYTRHEALEQ